MLPEVQEMHARGKTQRVFVRPFAWNLHAPTHMEWSPDGRLFVVERTTGKIKDTTKGGDLADAPAVVEGLEGPSSMAVLPDGRMLVTEFWGGRIREITEGGKADHLPILAEGLNGPYSLDYDRIGRLAVTVRETTSVGRSVEIDLNDGTYRTLVSGTPLIAPKGFFGFAPPNAFPDDYRLFASCNDWKKAIKAPGLPYTFALAITDMVVLIPEERRSYTFQELATNHVLATGLGWTGGMTQHPFLDQLFITQPIQGSVMALDLHRLGRDVAFEPPQVRNLPLASCVRFDAKGEVMFVCSPANGVIWQVEGAVRA